MGRRKRKRATQTKKRAKKPRLTKSNYPNELLGSILQFLPTNLMTIVPTGNADTAEGCTIVGVRKRIFPLRNVVTAHASLPDLAVRYYPFTKFEAQQRQMFLILHNVNAMKTQTLVRRYVYAMVYLMDVFI